LAQLRAKHACRAHFVVWRGALALERTGRRVHARRARAVLAGAWTHWRVRNEAAIMAADLMVHRHRRTRLRHVFAAWAAGAVRRCRAYPLHLRRRRAMKTALASWHVVTVDRAVSRQLDERARQTQVTVTLPPCPPSFYSYPCPCPATLQLSCTIDVTPRVTHSSRFCHSVHLVFCTSQRACFIEWLALWTTSKRFAVAGKLLFRVAARARLRAALHALHRRGGAQMRRAVLHCAAHARDPPWRAALVKALDAHEHVTPSAAAPGHVGLLPLQPQKQQPCQVRPSAWKTPSYLSVCTRAAPLLLTQSSPHVCFY